MMPPKVPKAAVREDIRRVAEKLGKVPTRNEYAEHGEYSGWVAEKKFGTWTEAREAAGLEGGPTKNTYVNETEVVRELRRVANKLGESPSQPQYNEHGQYSHQIAYERFGSWNAALEAAGLETERDDRTPNEKLLASIRAVAETVDGVPSQTDYHEHGEHGVSVLQRRFGSWSQAVKEAGYEPRTVGPACGEENPAWAGGYGDYYGPNWNTQRERALERDGHECAACGCSEQEHREEWGAGLEVHHIRPARLFDDFERMNRLENLVTLCMPCHHRYERLPNVRAKELIR
jgi:hypothetical protein